MSESFNRISPGGRVKRAGNRIITLRFTFCVTRGWREVVGSIEVARGAALDLDTGKTPGWAGATPLFATCLWPKDHGGRSSPSKIHPNIQGQLMEHRVKSTFHNKVKTGSCQELAHVLVSLNV